MLLNMLRKVRPLWRLKQSFLYKQAQKNLDFPVFVKLPSTNFKVAILALRDLTWLITALGVKTNVESTEVTDVFLKVLKESKPRVFWDVGANIGLYSWMALSHSSIESVSMFEADATNFSLLKRTQELNHLEGLNIHNVAVSNSCGSVSFLVDPVSGATGCIQSDDFSSSSAALHREYGLDSVVSVNSISLDSLETDDFIPPDLIKIDVEGAEHLVLSGAESIISHYQPNLVVETTNLELIEALKRKGYEPFELEKGNVLFLSRKNSGSILRKKLSVVS